MVIILCHPEDESAGWLYPRLLPTIADLEIISFDELVYAKKINYHVDSKEDTGTIELFDDRRIENKQIRGIINRVRTMPQSHLGTVKAEDRSYALEELNAFWLAWLDGLSCPVLNPARPQSLAGSWLNPATLMQLSALANLPGKDWQANTKIGADALLSSSPAATRARLIVFNGKIFGQQNIPADIQEGCRRLSGLTGMPLLQIEFDRSEAMPWCFATAHGSVNFELGGEALVAELANTFSQQEASK